MTQQQQPLEKRSHSNRKITELKKEIEKLTEQNKELTADNIKLADMMADATATLYRAYTACTAASDELATHKVLLPLSKRMHTLVLTIKNDTSRFKAFYPED